MASEPVKLYRTANKRRVGWHEDSYLACINAGKTGTVTAGTWYPDDGDEAAREVAGELLAALAHLAERFVPEDDDDYRALDIADAVLAKARGEVTP